MRPLEVFAKVLRSNRLVAAMGFALVLIAVALIYKWSHFTAGAVVYNEEYAGRFADMCRREDPKNTGCPISARAQESDFAGRFSAAFAGNQLCSGLRLVIYRGATESSEEEKVRVAEGDFWMLMVSFNAGQEKQNWDLTSKKSSNVLSGEGDAAQTSRQVCAIMKGRGGTVN